MAAVRVIMVAPAGGMGVLSMVMGLMIMMSGFIGGMSVVVQDEPRSASMFGGPLLR